MTRIRLHSSRGATSPLPIVFTIVFLCLGILVAWIWADMNKSNLAEKARVREELKGVPGPGIGAAQVQPGDPSIRVERANAANDANVVECRRATSPIKIDGNPDDEAWKSAQVVSNFALPWLGPNHPAKSRTFARLLWDDQFLYFLAEMDDTDVYADMTEHNSEIWNNDVFELFFKPMPTSLSYYEFQVNARNTTLELFFPSRGSGGYRRFKNMDVFHMESQVKLRGASTLNNPNDRDLGWVVEGRIPWSDFTKTGGKPAIGAEWKFALCRYDYSAEYDEPELSTCAPLTRSSFHRYEDFAVLKFK